MSLWCSAMALSKGCMLMMIAVCLRWAASRSRVRDAGLLHRGKCGQAVQLVEHARPQALAELFAEKAEVPDAPRLHVGRCDALHRTRRARIKAHQAFGARERHEFIVGHR